MSRERGDEVQPLPEAYSRVTNPERFRPLHAHALDLLARLQTTYDVVASERFAPRSGLLEPFEHARPPVTLTPVVSEAAPLAVAFTSFPSVIVHCGRWHVTGFPSCGCDACNENAADEAERLDDLAGKVVAGLFAEEIRIPRLFGDAWLYAWFGTGTPHQGTSWSNGATLQRRAARALTSSGPLRVKWRPWPHRPKR